MQNVAPTRRLSRRSRDMLVGAALVFLIGACAVVVGISLHILNLVIASNPGAGFYDFMRKALLSLGSGLIFVSFMMALRAITWKTDNQLARQVGEQLGAQLDRNFVFIRNISQRGIGTLDAALVSKHGLLILRVCGRKGRLHNEKAHWLRRGRKGQWIPMRWNPTAMALRDLRRMRAYLQGQGLEELPIFAAIVFIREAPLVELTLRDPSVPVAHSSQLVPALRDSYFARDRLDPATMQRVLNLLYH